MPDERRDSIEQGINAPEESETGREAAARLRAKTAEEPPIGGAMGGTSDADSPGDEALSAAQQAAARRRKRAETETSARDEPDTSDHPAPDDLE